MSLPCDAIFPREATVDSESPNPSGGSGSTPLQAIPFPGGSANSVESNRPGLGGSASASYRADLSRMYLEEAGVAILGHWVVATVTVLLFWNGVPRNALLAWYAMVLLATVGRWTAVRAARRQSDPQNAERLLFFGVLGISAAWAFGALTLGMQLPTEDLGFLLMILAGLVAAAIGTMVSHPASFYVFCSFLLGSALVGVLLRPPTQRSWLALVLITAFGATIAAVYRRAHGHLLQGLRASQGVQKAEEQYRLLVQNLRDLVWQVDLEGRWTFLNEAAREIYGAAPEALLGTSALDRAVPESREKDYAAFTQVLVKRELVDHETVHRTVDGALKHLSFSARPAFDANGRLVGVQGTARDVTEVVRARELLREAGERGALMRVLLNSIPDLVCYRGIDGTYRGCNPAFVTFIGIEESQLIGKREEDLFGDENARLLREKDAEALRGRVPVRFEMWATTPSGERRFLEVAKTPVLNDAGEPLGILGVARDRTDRKLEEERIRQLAREAEEAARMKSAFLANMSHEIRTPMNGILGMTELLLASPLSDEQRRSLEVIRSSGEALLEILNDILDLSKIEAGRMELESVPFDLHDVVTGSAQVFALQASQKGNELAVDIRPDVPHGVIGDPTRLRQVLSNLLSNAVKFTENGEILVTVSVTDSGADRARVRFAVRDTGIGIPPDRVEAIFGEFVQAESSTARRYGGTGLGLTISRRLVDLMGGRMGVRSQVGEGSEFFFTLELPLAPDWRPQEEEGPEEGELAGRRALVVDDHATNRRIFREFLEGAGLSTETASSADQALETLRRAAAAGHPFDVAILDVAMPGMDGFHLAQEIRNDPDLREIPILISTSVTIPGHKRRAEELKIASYLLKPLSRKDLLRAVRGALRGLRIRTERAPTPTGPLFAGREVRVLVVEDNPVNQQVAKGMLENWGITVQTAASGQEALRAVASGAFDLVLMDVQMPDLDGLEATRRIRRIQGLEGLPVVALTAHALEEHRQQCLEAGMNDFLSKPFRAAELREVLLRWLGSPVDAGGPPDGGTGGGALHPLQAAEGAAGPGEAGQVREPPVDLEGFRHAMREGGIEEVVPAVIEIFLAEMPPRMQELAGALERADAKGVEDAAHALKSGARNVRANRLGDLLELMEQRGREGNLEAARGLQQEILEEFEAVVRYLDQQKETMP